MEAALSVQGSSQTWLKRMTGEGLDSPVSLERLLLSLSYFGLSISPNDCYSCFQLLTIYVLAGDLSYSRLTATYLLQLLDLIMIIRDVFTPLSC